MKIQIVVYPDVTALDFVGPLQIWTAWPGAEIEVVAETTDPLPTDSVMSIIPTHSYQTAAMAPDILFIPGGAEGNLRAIQNDALLVFVRSRAEAAKWITSVCTGALILGAAGLLKGYRCTTHWLVFDHLKGFGGIPVAERWVIDRNRATGGGVTAGIDFGLRLMGEIAGRETAEAAQLVVEYAPKPPFDSGSPENARNETCDSIRAALSDYLRTLEGIMEAESARLAPMTTRDEV